MVTRILIKESTHDARNEWAHSPSPFVMAALTMLVFAGITCASHAMQRHSDDVAQDNLKPLDMKSIPW